MNYTKRVELPFEKPKKPFMYDTLKYDTAPDDRFVSYLVFGGLLGSIPALSIGGIVGGAIFGSPLAFLVVTFLAWILCFYAVNRVYKSTAKYKAWSEPKEYTKVCFAALPADMQRRLKPLYNEIVEDSDVYGGSLLTREVIKMAESMYAQVTEPIRQHESEVQTARRQERLEALEYIKECNSIHAEVIKRLG